MNFSMLLIVVRLQNEPPPILRTGGQSRRTVYLYPGLYVVGILNRIR